MRRLGDRLEGYLDYRAPVWALVPVSVALLTAALVLLLLLPNPPVVQLAVIFATAITGSWFLRAGIRVNRERKDAALADLARDDDAHEDPLP